MNPAPNRSTPLAPPRRRYEFAAIAGMIFAPALYCTTLIYPSAAIADLWLLDADDFKAKYAGINVSTLQPADEGWYVRYRHENLTYLFGPLTDREAARQALWEMQEVREAAVKNRPGLGSSQVDYVRFSYSNVFGKAGDTPQRGGQNADGKGKGGEGKNAGGGQDGGGANGLDGAAGKGGGADDRGGRDATGMAGANGDRAGLPGDANGGADAGGGESGAARTGERGPDSAGGQRGGRDSRGQAGAQNAGSGSAQPAGAGAASISGTSAGGGSQGQGSATGSQQPAAGGMSGASAQSGGSGNPLQLLGALLRAILGI